MNKLNGTKRIFLIGCIALVLAIVGGSIFSIPGFANGAVGDKTNNPATHTIDAPGGGDPVPPNLPPPGGDGSVITTVVKKATQIFHFMVIAVMARLQILIRKWLSAETVSIAAPAAWRTTVHMLLIVPLSLMRYV